MPKSWSLKQTKQCRHCPWRKDSDLAQIPDYSEDQHHDLGRTIVDNNINSYDPFAPVAFMACHNGTAIGIDLECTRGTREGWELRFSKRGGKPTRVALAASNIHAFD